MIQNYFKYFLSSFVAFSLLSCDNMFKNENYVAYFGGEIINPKSDYILFLKDDTILDTIYIDKQNRFFKKFDSLAPGLYTFQHSEYQYVYFDKNDSLMIRLNSNDFDGSLSFCGKGDQKNNYLIDLFLKNEAFGKSMNQYMSDSPENYIGKLDTYNKSQLSDYALRKNEINWPSDFDNLVKSSINFNYLYNKELFPFVNSLHNDTHKYPELPKDYFKHREQLDINHPDLKSFSSFTQYIHLLVNNIVYEKNNFVYDNTSLEANIEKLKVVDSLVKDQNTKNVVLNNIAYLYLLDDHCVVNHQKFIDTFLAISTDQKNNKEVKEFCNSIKKITKGNVLPSISLLTLDDKVIPSTSIVNNKETVVFFWTSEAESHVNNAIKKVEALQKDFPSVQFIAINVDSDSNSWLKISSQFDNDHIKHYRIKDFRELKEKWVINKIHRTIVINADGTIKNGFANLFDTQFSTFL